MQIELNDSEVGLVRELLEEQIKTVRVEIHHSKHHHEFKDFLKEKETLLESLLQKISAPGR